MNSDWRDDHLDTLKQKSARNIPWGRARSEAIELGEDARRLGDPSAPPNNATHAAYLDELEDAYRSGVL